VLEVVLVAAGLPDGVDLVLLHAAVADPDGLEVAAQDVVRVPALHFDDDDAEVRGDYHEVWVAVADDRLVVHDPVVGQFLQDGKKPLLALAAAAWQPVWDHLGHETTPLEPQGRPVASGQVMLPSS